MEFIGYHDIGSSVSVGENKYKITKVTITRCGLYYTVNRVNEDGNYQELHLYDFEITKFHSEKRVFRLIENQ